MLDKVGSAEFVEPVPRVLSHFLGDYSTFLALALIQGFPTDSATAWVTRSTT
jgi:hypothetical protein